MGKQDKKRIIPKEFLMTLAATTISIVLTFGTSAVIEHKKHNAEKREMVMMVLYDMWTSLEEIKECDEGIRSFIDIQLDMISHPQKFHESYVNLIACSPILTYTNTTENIFRSNIETINTIGNFFFVETVSLFYDYRSRYKTEVVETFNHDCETATKDYESLSDFNSTSILYYSSIYYSGLRRKFEQSKAMMKVSEQDLEAFGKERTILFRSINGKSAAEETGKIIEEKRRLNLRFQQAREEGRKATQ